MNRQDTALDEQGWSEWLGAIEAGRVVPVLGAELLVVQTDDGPQHLHDWLGAALAQALDLPSTEPSPPRLADVLSRCLALQGRRDEAFAHLHRLLGQARFSPPPSLYKLAAITDLRLFINTGFDGLMTRALNDVRGADTCQTRSYAPNHPVDLPGTDELASAPWVYHLLGRSAAWPGHAIGPEDQLETLCALLNPERCPEGLLAILQPCQLLVLGSELDDGLLHLMLRVLRGGRLSAPRRPGELLADAQDRASRPWLRQLALAGAPVRTFAGASAFIDELHRRWLARRPVVHLAEPVRLLPPAPEMPDGAVYLCHTPEDLAAVQTLKAGLDAAGISSWFDTAHPDAGEVAPAELEARLREHIDRCASFVAVISRHTQGPHGATGPCELQWAQALSVAQQRPDRSRFIQTVLIDPLSPDPDSDALPMPELLRGTRLHCLPGGELNAGLVAQLRTPD